MTTVAATPQSTAQNYVPSVIGSVPKYDGLIPQPANDVLSFEFSPFTKLDPVANPHGYIEELAKANERLDFARAKLEGIKDEPFWKTANGHNQNVPLSLWNPLQDARKAVAPFKQFDPADQWFADNEVPRYAPDGTMLAEDAAKVGSASDAARVAKPGANTYIENISVRWPAEQLQGVDSLKFAEARAKSEQVSRMLTWDESSQKVPDIEGAIGGIDDIKQLLADGLGTSTGAAKSAGAGARLSHWFHTAGPVEKGAVALGGVGAAALAGVAVKKVLDD
jgi:hypothetical protein